MRKRCSHERYCYDMMRTTQNIPVNMWTLGLRIASLVNLYIGILFMIKKLVKIKNCKVNMWAEETTTGRTPAWNIVIIIFANTSFWWFCSMVSLVIGQCLWYHLELFHSNLCPDLIEMVIIITTTTNTATISRERWDIDNLN